MSVEERFWAKVSVGPLPEHCWQWLGYRNRFGYGCMRTHRATGLAHRVSYGLNVGRIPDGMCVLHLCDNPPCCNPMHLVAGDRALNHSHMVERGRRAEFNGEQNGRCRHSPSVVDQVRRMRAESGMSQVAIARETGMSNQHVCRIVNGRQRRNG